MKYTAKIGREVKGGGGILPDIIVERDSLPALLTKLHRKRLFFTFGVSYNTSHEVVENWEVDDDVLSGFKEHLDEEEFDYESDENFYAHRDDLSKAIKRRMFSIQFNEQAGVKIAIDSDNQVMHAVGHF